MSQYKFAMQCSNISDNPMMIQKYDADELCILGILRDLN